MKVKFYSMKCFAALAVLLSVGSASSAQVVTTKMEDYYTGNPYTQSGNPIKFTYTIYNNQQATMTGLNVADKVPLATTYYPESSVVNGVAVSDVNGRALFMVDDFVLEHGGLLPTQWGNGVLPSGQTVTLTYITIADANAGVIKSQYDGSVRGSFNGGVNYFDYGCPQATIYIADDASCSFAFISHGASATSGGPNNTISTVNNLDGSKINQVFINTSTNYYYANNNLKAALGTQWLTDVSAMAFDNSTQRLYFVNNSTTTQQELYYISTSVFPARVYKFSNTINYPIPAGTGAGKNITRMTWTPYGYGYALTDDGSHLFKITVNGNVPTYTDMGPLEDFDPADPSVFNETGGDIATDYYGFIYLVTSSGKFYIIQMDQENERIAQYKGVLPGLPTSGNQSLTFNQEGRLIVGGAYQNAYAIYLDNGIYASSIAGGSTIWNSGDYASCYFPPSTFRKGVNTKPADKPNTTDIITNPSVRVSPNPFINSLNLKVSLPSAETVKIRLMDMFGRSVYTSTQKLSGGVNTINVNIPGSLKHGIYVLDVWAGNTRLATKKLSHL